MANVYKINEKFWSWGDEYTITDQHGTPQYKVFGKVFSWGDDLSLQDMGGKQVARIKQKMLSFTPRYQIFSGGNMIAEMVKEFSWFKKRFTLDVPGPNDYTIDGKFWYHEYSFTRGGAQVARISKNLWGWTDAYGIEIEDGQDDVAILCSCIVIDQILDDQRRD